MFQAESAGEAPPPRAGQRWPRSVTLGLMLVALTGLVGGVAWLGGLVGAGNWLHAPWEDNRRSPLSSLLEFALAEPANPTAPATRPAMTVTATGVAVVVPSPEATPTVAEPTATATPTGAPPTITPAARTTQPPPAAATVTIQPARRGRAEPEVALQPSVTPTFHTGPPAVIAPGLTPLLVPPAVTATSPPIMIRPGPRRAAAATARAQATPVRQRQAGTP